MSLRRREDDSAGNVVVFDCWFSTRASVRREWPLRTSHAALGRCRWKIPTGLLVELGSLAQRGHVTRDQKLTQRVAIELLSFDPVEARRFDHSEPRSEGASQNGSRLRDAVTLQNPRHHDVAVLLEDGADLGVDGDAAAVDGGVDGAMLLDVVQMRVDRRRKARVRWQRGIGLGELSQLDRRSAHRLDVEFPLVLEVMVEEALRDAGGFGHVLDGDVLVAAGREELDAELQELEAALIRLQSEPTS